MYLPFPILSSISTGLIMIYSKIGQLIMYAIIGKNIYFNVIKIYLINVCPLCLIEIYIRNNQLFVI